MSSSRAATTASIPSSAATSSAPTAARSASRPYIEGHSTSQTHPQGPRDRLSGPIILVTGGAASSAPNIVARLAADPCQRGRGLHSLGEAQSGKWRNLAKHPIADLVPPEAIVAVAREA